jgi:hypothetical protein
MTWSPRSTAWPRKSCAWLSDDLLQVENLLHHGEPFPGLQPGERFEKPSHLLLPALIHGVPVQFLPSLLEILHPHAQKQILIAAEDRVIGNPGLLQFREQFRPNVPVFAVVFFNGVWLQPEPECAAWHATKINSAIALNKR